MHIGSINIAGLGRWRKHDEERIHRLVCCIRYHRLTLVALCETWLKWDAESHCLASALGPHWRVLTQCRTLKSGTSSRGSGGLAWLIDSSAHADSSLINDATQGALWIQIQHKQRKIFCCAVYCRPHSHRHNSDDCHLLLQQILNSVAEHRQHGSVILAGDFNRRIAELPTIIDHEHHEREAPTSLVRTSADANHVVTSRDSQFMHLMNAHSMIILNGLFGRRAEFTFARCAKVTSNASSRIDTQSFAVAQQSVIDYIAIDSDSLHLVDQVHSLRVEGTSDTSIPLGSDHLFIHARLIWTEATNVLFDSSIESQNDSSVLHNSQRIAYSWRDSQQQNAYSSKSTQAMRWWLSNSQHQSLEQAACSWQHALIGALHSTVQSRSLRAGDTQRRVKIPRSIELRSLDDACNIAYKLLHQTMATSASSRNIGALYDQFRRLRRDRNNQRRHDERKWGLEQAEWMSTLQSSDARRFWQRLNTICGLDASLRSVPLHQVVTADGSLHIGASAVVHHYIAAFAHQSSDDSQQLPTLPLAPSPDGLDNDFTIDEISSAIASSRIGKSAGDDNIPVEAFKYAGDGLKQSLARLFNRCLHESLIPPQWSIGLITLLHKQGDRRCPSNYRPITLLPTVCKILCRCINSRLSAFLEQSNRLAEQQFGRPHRSCTDAHVIFHQTLQQNIIEQQGVVYCATVDLRKAFDSINRARLLERLHQKGITGRLHRLIRAIYNNVQGKLQLGSKETHTFTIGRGVKQGL